MKFLNNKGIIYIVITLLVLSLSGCQEPKNIQDATNKEYNIIKRAELSKDEENLFGASGVDRFFVFDYHLIDTNGRWAEIWIDYYEEGTHVSKIASGDFMLDKEEGRIALTIDDIPNSDQREYVVSLMDETGYSSGSINTNKRQGDISSTWKTIEEREIVFEDDLILAVIVESKGNQTMGISEDIFDEDQKAIRDVLQNDYVYILKCHFR